MRRSHWFLVPYILPALLVYGAFMALPLFFSLRLSLFDWNGIGPKTYIGVGNFVRLFSEEPWNVRFWGAFGNNIRFFLMMMLFQNVPALLLAWFLYLRPRGTQIFRNLFFLPVTMSLVMVGYVGKLLLNPLWGPLNKLFDALSLQFLSRPWLGERETALFAIALIGSWQYIGIPLVLFLSGMENIPEELVEAARIDGAGEIGVFRHVLMPLLAPVFGIVAVLTFVGNFTGFELIYATEGTHGGPSFATDIFGTFFYRVSFGATGSSPSQMGLGAAIAVCMFVIIGLGVALWLWYNRWVNRKLG